LQGVDRLLFIPFALAQRDAYVRIVRRALEPTGLEVDSLHEFADPIAAVQDSQAIFIGGGNTFRLLKTLYDLRLMNAIRQRVLAGTPYIGSSAGTNLACPTILTTNDMPIVQPPDFAALELVPFQINPHYLDVAAGSTHQGESREQRLMEYLEENTIPVVAIREGCWLSIEGNRGSVEGQSGAVLFRRDERPCPMEPGGRLDDLLAD
jgi:dipeptidase E